MGFEFQENNYSIWKKMLDGQNYNKFDFMVNGILNNGTILDSEIFVNTISQS